MKTRKKDFFLLRELLGCAWHLILSNPLACRWALTLTFICTGRYQWIQRCMGTEQSSEKDIMRKMCAVKQTVKKTLTRTDWVWPDQILHDNHQRQSRGQSVELRLKGKVLEWVLVQYTHYFVHLNCLCRLKAAYIKHWTIGPSWSDSVTISFLTKYFHFLSVELIVFLKNSAWIPQKSLFDSTSTFLGAPCCAEFSNSYCGATSSDRSWGTAVMCCSHKSIVDSI